MLRSAAAVPPICQLSPLTLIPQVLKTGFESGGVGPDVAADDLAPRSKSKPFRLPIPFWNPPLITRPRIVMPVPFMKSPVPEPPPTADFTTIFRTALEAKGSVLTEAPDCV